MTRDEQLVRAALEAAEKLSDDNDWESCDCGCPGKRTPKNAHADGSIRLAKAIRVLDPAAIIAGVPPAAECPHIVSNSEGSAYCDLAAASVLKMDAENEELRQRVQELEALLRECHGHWMCDDNPDELLELVYKKDAHGRKD